MTVEWFLVSLPVVFLLGRFAARLDIRHIRKTAGELPKAYLHGLSHLLRGEKKRAMEWFLRAQPLAPESVELQFAIGELSRNRGEHRRALKTHQSLCERETLPPAVHRRALWELAGDYFQMGFFDLAEKHAAFLVTHDDYRERANNMLLDIRQRLHDYRRALDIMEQLPADAALMQRVTRAHLLCECAQRQPTGGPARDLLNQALSADNRCVRANLLLAEAATATKDFTAAIDFYAAVERQNTDYLWCAVSGLLAAYEAQNMATAGGDKIRAWLDAHPSPMLFDAVYQQLAARGQAKNLAAVYVQRGLGLIPAARWAAEQLRQAADEHQNFWRTLEKTMAADDGWRCEVCGYRTADFVWQCHNCLSWESFKPAAGGTP